MNTTANTTQAKPLMPDATIVCDTYLGAVVHVRTAGGWGGQPLYAGGFIKGFTGHDASLLSAADMRAIAAALISAADRIDANGMKSFEELKGLRK